MKKVNNQSITAEEYVSEYTLIQKFKAENGATEAMQLVNKGRKRGTLLTDT
jgi:hypothetical protein